MTFTRLWAHDGNNSLKRMLPVGSRVAADTRVFNDSDYFLSREYVDQYANEVKSQPPTTRKRKHREISSGDSTDEDSDQDDDDGNAGQVDPMNPNGEGDPTDGVRADQHADISQCVKNWKAAASDDKKKTWAIFDETGIYASACRHGSILWICDMVRSGEL